MKLGKKESLIFGSECCDNIFKRTVEGMAADVAAILSTTAVEIIIEEMEKNRTSDVIEVGFGISNIDGADTLFNKSCDVYIYRNKDTEQETSRLIMTIPLMAGTDENAKEMVGHMAKRIGESVAKNKRVSSTSMKTMDDGKVVKDESINNKKSPRDRYFGNIKH